MINKKPQKKKVQNNQEQINDQYNYNNQSQNQTNNKNLETNYNEFDENNQYEQNQQTQPNSSQNPNFTPKMNNEDDPNTDYYFRMFGIGDASQPPNNYQNMYTINSVASENSRIYKSGEQFSSPITGENFHIESGQIGEKEQHLEYMLNFRVQRDAEENEEPNGFNCNSAQPTRRRPIYDGKTWNYKPTMCNNVKIECKAGESCQQCHNREELVYHPLVFKTKLCEYTVDGNGSCSKQGRHCAKAHGQGDKRMPTNSKPPTELSRDTDLQILTSEVQQMIWENKTMFYEDKMNNIYNIINNGINNHQQKKKVLAKFDSIYTTLTEQLNNKGQI